MLERVSFFEQSISAAWRNAYIGISKYDPLSKRCEINPNISLPHLLVERRCCKVFVYSIGGHDLLIQPRWTRMTLHFLPKTNFCKCYSSTHIQQSFNCSASASMITATHIVHFKGVKCKRCINWFAYVHDIMTAVTSVLIVPEGCIGAYAPASSIECIDNPQ